MTQTYNLPDGPRKTRLWRLLKLIFQPVKYVEDFHSVYGDCFTIWGRKSHIVYFSQPEAIQQIFAVDASHLEAGNRVLSFLLGDNSLVALNGERHQRQRQLLTPPFHGDRMRAYGETIREITQEVMSDWKPGKPFNIRASMQEITLRVILRVVFGLDEGQRYQQLRELLTNALESISSPLTSSFLFFGFLQKDLGSWSPWGRVLRLIEKIDELIYGLIQERRRESNCDRQDILSLMMSARDEDGQPMSDVELRDELMTLLMAGHETTASALTWAFYWVDHVPEVQDKLLLELDPLNDNPEPAAIAKLPYLTAVCNETLRIYPIVMTAFLRRVKSPVEIMGYQLPAGTTIVPSVYLAHHREEVYPQSKQFKPERFLERQFSPYEFFPFGGGIRRCMGMAFAQYEMKLVLATVLSQLQVSMVNKRPVNPVRRGFTLAAPAGMRMVATPRQVIVKTTVSV
ncbi:MAG: cytochrome P450 [Nostocaceae cyanobacterium]|nr:cytochrome P450 [Nostocaceae cyanobacterium]